MVMRGKSAWRKNNRREVKNTIERYLAIFAIIALGTGFFAGLKVTQRAMVETFDKYAHDQKMYDFQLISTLGLSKEDLEYFANKEGMTAEGIISQEFIADIDMDNDLVLKAHSISDKINILSLQSGRMPEIESEVVVDARFFPEDSLGSKIRIASSNDEDTREAFTYDEYTVVGRADSVNYLNYDRGTTKLAGGSVYGFIYILEGGFTRDFYTEILIELEEDYQVYSDEYENMVLDKEKTLEEAMEVRASLRYDEIVEEVSEELIEVEEEYNEAYEEYLSEKADAEKELDDAKIELSKAKQEILDAENDLIEAEEELDKGENEYQEGLEDYEEALREFEEEKANVLADLDNKQKELNDNKYLVVSGMKQIEESGVLDQYKQVQEAIATLEASLLQIKDPTSEEYLYVYSQLEMTKGAIAEIEATGIIEQYSELESSLTKLEAGQVELDAGIELATRQFSEAQAQLKNAKLELDNAKDEIESGKQEIADGWQTLEEGRIEYEDGLKEYEDGKKEADESFAEAEEELADARKKLDEAWEKVHDIPEAKTFVLNRNHNMGYATFENDSAIVDGIAKVLPLFFYLVAVLICSNTMSRMVDEQRTQIGTLKALGYSDRAVIMKYISYSGSAALYGWIIGFFFGTKFFPMAIWKSYGMMYSMPAIEYMFDGKLALISLLVSILSSAGVTYLSCKSELKQMPSQLIRPKAPQAGKRVLLERIPFIWKRIGFLHKVAIRNIIRYKKRFFMIILGVSGCTALIVAAMGISDSIRNIANNQFDDIMVYDYNISFIEEQGIEDREGFTNKYEDDLSEVVFVVTDEVEVVNQSTLKKASLVATDNPNITDMIKLNYNGDVVAYPKDGQVAINDKLAKDFNVKVGDIITIKINEIETVDIEVGGIFENYVSNYLFMTERTYQELFSHEASYSNAYARTDKEDLYQVSAELTNDEDIASVAVINDMRLMVENMMKSLDDIILLVIVCAIALGFVVVYNLNNINITERNREVATIKVLGFYDNETRAYVYRETTILTILGALLGLVFGKLLHGFIMSEINVEAVSFKEQIFSSSYILAFVITIVLSLLVNLIFRKKIEDINMTESLKAVE